MLHSCLRRGRRIYCEYGVVELRGLLLCCIFLLFAGVDYVCGKKVREPPGVEREFVSDDRNQ